MKIVFTHYWVTGFGWENTIFQPEDFATVDEFGMRDGSIIFIAIGNDFNGAHILKGHKIVTT